MVVLLSEIRKTVPIASVWKVNAIPIDTAAPINDLNHVTFPLFTFIFFSLPFLQHKLNDKNKKKTSKQEYH